MSPRKAAKALETALETLPERFLECRDLGHSWRPWTARAFGGRLGGFESVLRCSDCGTLRTRTLSRTGAVMSSHYTYPDGYLVAGLGRLTGTDRDAVRLASIRHMLAHESEWK